MKLKVSKILNSNEVFRDMARVSERYRVDPNTRPIEEGSICKVKVKTDKRSIRLALRGDEQDRDLIQVDDKTRKRLVLTVGTYADFEFRRVTLIGEFLWAWSASDTAYRIAARLSLLSLLLGVIGLGLGIIGICGLRS
jgi:hypothetical protein